MALRDQLEQVLRSWHTYELSRGAPAVIDFDCHPAGQAAPDVTDRLEVHRQLVELREAAAGDAVLSERLAADLAYLRALLGERLPLGDYLQLTQGCAADGWSGEYIALRGEQARSCLAELGIGWHGTTDQDLESLEGPLTPDEAPEAIQQAADELEPLVRHATGATAEFRLRIETADVDAYWAYWLDGAGQDVRLRLNLRRARFTTVRARQFALHEVLGHGLQYASLAERCAKDEVPWVRLLSVFSPQQMVFEGLAQAMPLFVTPDDPGLTARVRLDHYLRLVEAELHLAINEGVSAATCAAHAHARVPFWSDATIADHLTDYGTDPLLRSYLWSYPAGIDWFVALAEAPGTVATEVIHAAYRDPLTPRDLAARWPAGPAIRGDGSAVRLRQPPLS
ncbi:hypothetical protein ALI22I_19655 [Saccharothrix sp. ALI-22-I]|uniref:hypothetical protein n=1 Tax=Saccharothrix sp. ALI-22-I TaxID=1933778 RepID=UPI00097BCB13|nr:hypothetical protein [Saccharothrix sp. ALI-22-I]ONI87972.1 hypothetical protein ALI22I_19655 [Saccharothrix sp. ALI-22-I]